MMKKIIAKANFIRALVFPLLRCLDFEVQMKHDITKRPLNLMSWLHKSYWYYGLSRNSDEAERYRELIKEGDNVLDIGGHIGYITQFFEHLVGEKGKVIVAEPTPRSRYFLQQNVRPDTKILPIAFANKAGTMDFYTEDSGGFTNSLDYGFVEENTRYLRESHNVRSTRIQKIEIEVDTIDAVCEKFQFQPNFIKIDVEGAELSVLQGALEILPNVRGLMVEITRNHKEVYALLYDAGFTAFTPNGIKVTTNQYPGENIFFRR